MIKLFEEYNEYYTEITEGEYITKAMNMEPEALSVNNNFDKLLSLFTPSWYLTSGKNNSITYVEFTFHDPDAKSSGLNSVIDRKVVKIYKKVDEWYIVSCMKHIQIKEFIRTKKHPNYYNWDDTLENNYYLCDQWEGLLKCLNDKIYI